MEAEKERVDRGEKLNIEGGIRKVEVGAHLRFRGSYKSTVEEGRRLGVKTIQFFPTLEGSSRLAFPSEEDCSAAEEWKSEGGKVIVHISYLVNLAILDPGKNAFSYERLGWELNVAEKLLADYVVLHPGSASGLGRCGDWVRRLWRGKLAIIDSIARLSEKFSKEKKKLPLILLENTPHAGMSVGSFIGDVHEVAERCNWKVGSETCGVCFDTAHAFVFGYTDAEIVSWSRELAESGLLKVLHFNDAKERRGSRKDVHEVPGRGRIGKETLLEVIKAAATALPAQKKLFLVPESPKGREQEGVEETLRLVEEAEEELR